MSLVFPEGYVSMQETKWQSAEERKADALAAARGFAFHIQDAIRNTPAEGVSRNRIMDRCAAFTLSLDCNYMVIINLVVKSSHPVLGCSETVIINMVVKYAHLHLCHDSSMLLMPKLLGVHEAGRCTAVSLTRCTPWDHFAVPLLNNGYPSQVAGVRE